MNKSKVTVNSLKEDEHAAAVLVNQYEDIIKNDAPETLTASDINGALLYSSRNALLTDELLLTAIETALKIGYAKGYNAAGSVGSITENKNAQHKRDHVKGVFANTNRMSLYQYMQ